jgi:hypothetical protein
MDIFKRLTSRLRPIFEADETTAAFTAPADWKDPESAGYDRQYAEDCLYHTVGPLTDNPTWDTASWSSSSEPPEGYEQGGPAPRWSTHELTIAMSGDPGALEGSASRRGGPRSPAYGRTGGAPVFRIAKQLARAYGRASDENLIQDLYANGNMGLTRLLQPGYDKSQGPFIKFAMPRLTGYMKHGIGRTKAEERALRQAKKLADVSPTLGDEKEADSYDSLAEKIVGKYRNQSLHDVNSDNFYGPHSPTMYQILRDLAQAIKQDDADMVEDVKRRVNDLIEELESDVSVLGASTGIGQAITTKDRVSSVGISSIDQPKGDDDAGQMAKQIKDTSATNVGSLMADKDTVKFVLELSLKENIADSIKGSPTLQRVVARVASREGFSPADIEKAMSPITGTGYRYILRQMGPLANPYIGENVLRSSIDVPREKRGWWQRGEDPEIDRKPDGSLWQSEWRRNGREALSAREIADEMGREVVELVEIGIPTARQANLKLVDGKPTVMSQQSIDMTVRPIRARLALLAALYEQSDADYFEEHRLDRVDRQILAEACSFVYNHLCVMHNRDLIIEMREGRRNT